MVPTLSMHRWVLVACAGFGMDALQQQQAPGELGAHGPSYFTFGFHKTGTVLMHNLCNFMMRAATRNESADCAECLTIFNVSREGTWCERQGKVWEGQQIQSPLQRVFYNSSSTKWYFAVPLWQERWIDENFLEAYMIRDPLSAIASAYIYDQKMWDHEGAGREELQHLSLKDGLRRKCRDYCERILFRMLKIHKEKDPRILELRFEDFRTDYNTSARKLWRHMQGTAHPRLEQKFVDLASMEDMSSWTPEQLAKLPAHVSSKAQTESTIRALLELCEERDAAVVEALAYREKLGYPSNCSLPSEFLPRASSLASLQLSADDFLELDLAQLWR